MQSRGLGYVTGDTSPSAWDGLTSLLYTAEPLAAKPSRGQLSWQSQARLGRRVGGREPRRVAGDTGEAGWAEGLADARRV